jgi:redox-sensitive bicupin YhaK (pirin superfamily)
VLRVFNDDTINAYSGFDDHAHENMEIVTIMREGTLTHRDSMGNQKTINSGEIQRMSAGTGVIHAEKNLGDEPVHLFQLWFLPEKEGLEPSYEQKDFSYLEKNVLTPVVSNRPWGRSCTYLPTLQFFSQNLKQDMNRSTRLKRDVARFCTWKKGVYR